MMQEQFEDAAVKPQKWCVNYVWICPRESSRKDRDHATRLPLHAFERIYENVRKYPEASFNLWLDFRQLSLSDRFFLDSHRYLFNEGDLSVRNLREIPEYAKSPGFDVDSDIALYARADCARVLVLNHLLKGADDMAVVYSDLDCQDVGLSSPRLVSTVQEYGLAYGHSGRHGVVNGFIALQGDKGRAFMQDYLLSRTMTDFFKNKVNHFGAFIKAVRKYRGQNYPECRLSHWGVVSLPPMRTQVPYNENRYEGVCPSGKARVPGNLEFV